jgi:hypothetical protein
VRSGADLAVESFRSRAAAVRQESIERFWALIGTTGRDDHIRVGLDHVRLTVNFHPDRVARSGLTVADGLFAQGCYLSQWLTGLSSGSRSALRGGERHTFERQLFGDEYDAVSGDSDRPIYGALDLLRDPFGGSPRFGSSYLVLHASVMRRCTLCLGDSYLGPTDAGTIDQPWSILAGLAAQAAEGHLLGRSLGRDELLAALTGRRRRDGPGRELDGYIEAHVHGGISLAEDVESIVLDPSFASSDIEATLRRAASRYDFDLSFHGGSEVSPSDIPDEFRGRSVVDLARRVARPDGIVDAACLGRFARSIETGNPTAMGDPPSSDLQQVKYLWHAVVALGHDARLS